MILHTPNPMASAGKTFHPGDPFQFDYPHSWSFDEIPYVNEPHFRVKCSASATSALGVNGIEGRNPQGRTTPSPREPGAGRMASVPLSSC